MKKLGVIISDGVGLRNFAFTDFYKIGENQNFDITFWNSTPFDLASMHFKEIHIQNGKVSPFIDLYKNALIQLELSQNIKRSNDTVYDSYRFPFSGTGLKPMLKKKITDWLIYSNNSEKGIKRIRRKIAKKIRGTDFYQMSLQQLKDEKLDMLFCTNQRITHSLAPVLAAQDLGIPTATFIFSWDNLPKGTKILETDYYFVWSEHMKRELLYYYPEIVEAQVFITGTPQFEPHFDKSLIIPKADFFADNGMDIHKKYICFSGDDVTTSPYDPQYLSDTADAVRILNRKGNNIGILFRRCPVDFLDRYDTVLAKNGDLIISLDPQWEKMGAEWNAVLPTKTDLQLLMNTIFHSELVVNLGSTMAFDFVTRNKPCAYINYDVQNTDNSGWSVTKIYNFIHFRSMPSKDAVFWLNSSAEIADKIETMLQKKGEVIHKTQEWFRKINLHPVEQSSQRIWEAIHTITKNK